jgi:hypothetical protein
VFRGVHKEDEPTGTGAKLMGSSGRDVRLVDTPEDPEVGVGGSGDE